MLNLKRYLRSEKGFTMIEMMVVLIIIGVLIAGAVTLYLGHIENARVTKAKSYITTLQAEMDAYYAAKNEYPDEVDELIEAGIRPNSDWSTTHKLKAIDPWGKQYTLTVTNSDTGDDTYTIKTGFDKVGGDTGKYVKGEGKSGESTLPVVGS